MTTIRAIQNYVAEDFGYYSWTAVLSAFQDGYIEFDDFRKMEEQCIIQYYNEAVFG